MERWVYVFGYSKMSNIKIVDNTYNQRHPFHLVNPSPWPIFTALWLILILLQFVNYIHYDFCQIRSSIFFLIGEKLTLRLFLVTVFTWFYDIVIEATFEGHHTKAVQRGLRYGIILFIISEIIFFFGFFWAFFHSSLNPSIFIGSIWPPKGILPLETWNIPFLNTIILLSSGIAVTWSHLELLSSSTTPNKYLSFKNSILGLILTIFYGLLFTIFQRYEYINAQFDISDSVYGSTFFIITGLHGFHVIIGTVLLFVQLLRIIKYHLTPTHHLGYEAAIWYWHFVDIVWLFVFSSVYFWSNFITN